MTPTPQSGPAEIASYTTIEKLQSGHADVLKYLENANMAPDVKTKFEKKYKDAIDALAKKHEAKKTKEIWSVQAELDAFKWKIEQERKDENKDIDEKTDDETSGKEHLDDAEIDGRINELTDKIEAKLNANEVIPTEKPKEELPPGTQDEIKQAQKFFVAKGIVFDEKPPEAGNFFTNFLNKIKIAFYKFLAGLGFDVRDSLAQTEWYANNLSKQHVEATFRFLPEYMGESVKSISDVKDKEAIVEKIKWLGLPIENIQPILKFIFTGDSKAWEDIPESVDKDTLYALRWNYIELRDNHPKDKMTAKDKLNAIFTLPGDETERNHLMLLASTDEMDKIAPASTQTEAEPAKPTEADKLAAEKAEIKSAEDVDEALAKAEQELATAKVATTGTEEERKKNVENAQNNVNTAKATVDGKVTESKKRVEETLSATEQKLKDINISIRQAKTKVVELEKKYIAGGSKDKTELTAAQNELTNLETIQKPAIEKAIKDIQWELAKFPKKPEEKMTAAAAVLAAQDSERYTQGSLDIAQTQMDRVWKDKTEAEKEAEITKEWSEITKEITDTLHWSSSTDIDYPEELNRIKVRFEKFCEGKTSEQIRKLGVPSQKEILTIAQAKIDLIKEFNKVEKHIIEVDKQKVDYDDWGEWVQVDWGNLDIRRTGFMYTDYTMLTSSDTIIQQIGGLVMAQKVLKGNTEMLKSNKKFHTKQWVSFTRDELVK